MKQFTILASHCLGKCFKWYSIEFTFKENNLGKMDSITLNLKKDKNDDTTYSIRLSDNTLVDFKKYFDKSSDGSISILKVETNYVLEFFRILKFLNLVIGSTRMRVASQRRIENFFGNFIYEEQHGGDMGDIMEEMIVARENAIKKAREENMKIFYDQMRPLRQNTNENLIDYLKRCLRMDKFIVCFVSMLYKFLSHMSEKNQYKVVIKKPLSTSALNVTKTVLRGLMFKKQDKRKVITDFKQLFEAWYEMRLSDVDMVCEGANPGKDKWGKFIVNFPHGNDTQKCQFQGISNVTEENVANANEEVIDGFEECIKDPAVKEVFEAVLEREAGKNNQNELPNMLLQAINEDKIRDLIEDNVVLYDENKKEIRFNPTFLDCMKKYITKKGGDIEIRACTISNKHYTPYVRINGKYVTIQKARKQLPQNPPSQKQKNIARR